MFLHRVFLKEAPVSELEDIVRNLRLVLGSRRGGNYFQEEFGLSQVGYRTPQEALVSMAEEIRENLARFEPRVELLEIEEKHEERQAYLVLELRLKHDTSQRLSVVADPGRRYLRVELQESQNEDDD